MIFWKKNIMIYSKSAILTMFCNYELPVPAPASEEGNAAATDQLAPPAPANENVANTDRPSTAPAPVPYPANENTIQGNQEMVNRYKRNLKEYNALNPNRESATIKNDESDYNFIKGYLYCHECLLFHEVPITIGNQLYINQHIEDEESWFESDLISAFGHLLSHAAHKETPGINVSTQFFETILPENWFFSPVSNMRSTTNRVVSVFHLDQHFVTACFEVDTLNCTIYDGFHWKPNKWKRYISEVLMKCKLVDSDSKVVLKKSKFKNVQIIEFIGSTRTVQCKVKLDKFMKQTDEYSCGPIACLKLLELFERKNYLKDMDTGMYRLTVMEKLTSMLDAYEEEIFIDDETFKNLLENGKKF